jgi:DNA-binding NtrC family response regulator
MAGSSVVLVVEDDPLVRNHIANEFELAGWEVLHADSGERALHMLEMHGDRITAVFTDIDLGGQISGWASSDASTALSASMMPLVSIAGIWTTGARERPVEGAPLTRPSRTRP